MNPHWWLDFFDDDFADAFAAQDGHIAANVACIEQSLALTEGDRVFDQCCGYGRLALELAAKNYVVHGVDAMSSYVDRASERARIAGLAHRASFECADAFVWQRDEHFDAAFNWGTSFGYLTDDLENCKMLQRAFASLKPGGKFALEYYAVPRLIAAFAEHTTFSRSTPAGSLTVTRHASIDWARGLLSQRWTYDRPGLSAKFREGVTRMYMPHDLVRLCEKAGFCEVKLRSVHSEEFSQSSDRVVLVARKPERSRP
jgi:SAM-dependent methyltransferase